MTCLNEEQLQIISKLSKQYNFDYDEAVLLCSLPVLTKSRLRISYLPFIGIINPHWCQAVTYGYGLFTQCVTDIEEGETYCKACRKTIIHGQYNNNPRYGNISDRLKLGKTWFQVNKLINVKSYKEIAKSKNIDLNIIYNNLAICFNLPFNTDFDKLIEKWYCNSSDYKEDKLALCEKNNEINIDDINTKNLDRPRGRPKKPKKEWNKKNYDNWFIKNIIDTLQN